MTLSRVDAVLETCLEQPWQELPALAPEGHEVEFRRAVPDLFPSWRAADRFAGEDAPQAQPTAFPRRR